MLHLDIEKNLSISKCIENFYIKEKLDEKNKYLCKNCKKKQTCSKFSSIELFPEILIIHLKRFSYSGYYSAKKDYKIEIDDALEFSYDDCKGSKEITHYDLISIINHQGTLEGGHYTAFCKDVPSQKCYYFNDSQVSLIHNFGDEQSESAYIVFYQKKDNCILL